jgi:mannose-6-phosphate isomerase-like protein (cupin superfamily)
MIKFTVQASLEALSEHSESFLNLYRQGSLNVDIYKPEKTDPPTAHSRDEIYVIASGSGEFLCFEDCDHIERGDVLFVAAGVPHRFTNFSDDFATWVFFCAPEDNEESLLDPAFREAEPGNVKTL